MRLLGVSVVFGFALVHWTCSPSFQWPTPATRTSIPEFSEEHDAVVIAKTIRVVPVNWNQNRIEIWKRIRILKPSGVDKATLSFYTGKTDLEPPVIRARTLLPNGQTIEVPANEIRVQQVVEGFLKRSVVAFPKVVVGTEVECYIKTRQTMSSFATYTQIQEDLPILEARVFYECPDSIQMAFIIPALKEKPIKGPVENRKRVDRYTFSFAHLPAYKPSRFRSPTENKPEGIISFMHSLSRFSLDHYLRQIAFNPFVTGEYGPLAKGNLASVRPVAAKLVKGAKSRSDSIEACYRFVQEEIALSDKDEADLATPGEILSKRKANRPGKRLLLQEMLLSVGIRAGEVLVITQSDDIEIGTRRMYLDPMAWKELARGDWDIIKKRLNQLPPNLLPWFSEPQFENAVAVVDHAPKLGSTPLNLSLRKLITGAAHFDIPDTLYRIDEVLVPDRAGYQFGQIPHSLMGRPARVRVPCAVTVIDSSAWGYCKAQFSFLEHRFTLPQSEHATTDRIETEISIAKDSYTAKRSFRGDISSEVFNEYLASGHAAQTAYFCQATKSFSPSADTTLTRIEASPKFNVNHGLVMAFKGRIENEIAGSPDRQICNLGKLFFQELMLNIDSKEMSHDIVFGPIVEHKYSIGFKDRGLISLQPNWTRFSNDIGTIEMTSSHRGLTLRFMRNVCKAESAQAEAVMQFVQKLNEVGGMVALLSNVR